MTNDAETFTLQENFQLKSIGLNNTFEVTECFKGNDEHYF